MILKELIKGYNVVDVIGQTDIDIAALCHDHREVKSGYAFICIRGEKENGENYAAQAVQNGAICIVTEKALDVKVTQVIVDDAREAMSAFACIFYGNPSEKMQLVGVTGTNGKTTTCHLISEIIKRSGGNVGVIGTLGVFYCGKYIPPKLTTPDPIFLNKILADMERAGVKYVAMEVSAHACALEKIFGLKFAVKIFTNFTQDHLDFFGNMDDYFEAKKSFILAKDKSVAVYNSDDRRIRKSLINSDKINYSFGIENPSDVFAVNITEGLEGISFVMNLFDEIIPVSCNLNGLFNVYNCLAASLACYVLGFSSVQIENGLNGVSAVSGRAESISNKRGKQVFIDYAHTPDGLKQILTTLRKCAKKRLICLFGCGGNRDKAKRYVMGQIAGEYADFCIITSDNPRFEDPNDIINDVEKGLKEKTSNYITCEDRKKAISYALDYIKEGDILLIAGKGAEEYQEIMGTKLPFSDKKCVLDLLSLEDKR